MNGLLRIRQRYRGGLARSDKNWRIICCTNLMARRLLSQQRGQRSRSQSVQRREVRAKTRL